VVNTILLGVGVFKFTYAVAAAAAAAAGATSRSRGIEYGLAARSAHVVLLCGVVAVASSSTS